MHTSILTYNGLHKRLKPQKLTGDTLKDQLTLDMQQTKKADSGFNPRHARVSRVCQLCGFVHKSDDAYAINRFSQDISKFVARHGKIQRPTRAEAERDECNWRIHRATKTENARKAIPKISIPEKTVKSEPPKIQPFPAAMMEIAAREKAWLEFLAHVNLSLLVWQIDKSIHNSIDSPIVWLRRCSKELLDMLSDTNG